MNERRPDGAVIQTPDRRLRVFVSSTLGELAAERPAVSRAVAALRLSPVMFEAGARPHPPREVYQAYLARSDVFIGLYWQQYGQAGPGDGDLGAGGGVRPVGGAAAAAVSEGARARPTGAVDLPERQRTLRATVQWSVGLLEDAERSLLETVAVFVGGWTVEAAAEVAGLPEDRTLELTEALARHSLIYLDGSADGVRPRMLETIRAFVAERLAARPDVAEVQRRHAGYYRALAERADRPLRGAGHREWLERLEAEGGNLAAAVRWYLADDPTPLPHLFRVLWLFWELRDHMGEARAWVGQVLPAAGSLDLQARAELLWAAVATANEVHDDPAALAASHRLAPLLAWIEDRFLRALCQLVMAWTSPVTGDLDAALPKALASLEQLRGQDEPYWRAVAAVSTGYLETAVGHYDDAQRHVQETRDLAERFGYSWLAAWSRVQLGRLDIAWGRLDEARALLDEALDLSLAIYVTRNVTLCLVAYAQLALAEGDPGRAALLAGAVEGLRRRADLRAWPMLRRDEAALVDQIRRALGTGRFEQAYESGARLSQREAVAAVRGRRGASARQH